MGKIYTEAELQLSLNCYHRNGKNFAKGALELSIPRATLQHRVWEAEKRGLVPDKKYDLPFGHQLSGRSTLYDKEGNERLTWVKTSRDTEAQRLAIIAAVDALKQDIPKERRIDGPVAIKEDLATCYIVTDYHLGQLSWKEETGEEWSLTTAEELIVNWFRAAITAAPDSKVGILAQLGDLLHIDSILPVTPSSGNVLDADTRYAKIVETVIRILRRIVNMLLAKHDHVHVLLGEGNHDISSSIWLRALFAEKYEDNPRITVDTTSCPYYAFEWGDTSLFFHHGHKRKMDNVSEVFAGMYRGVYGRTKYSYAHMGHLHHVDVKENQMMIVEQHPTLAAKDAHSARGGYVSHRGASAITYHKKFGEVSRSTIRPEMV